MSTDITFCANSDLCPAKYKCRRSIVDVEAITKLEEAFYVSFANFQAEKGEDCEGYKPITKEQQP